MQLRQNRRALKFSYLYSYFHFGKLHIGGYTVGKLDLRRRASGAIDVQSHLRDYRPYTRRYTSSNQKSGLSYALYIASVNITVLGLTNPDVNLKRMHQLYIAWYELTHDATSVIFIEGMVTRLRGCDSSP